VRRRLLLALAFVLAFTPPPDAAAAAKEPALWEPGIRDPGRGLVGRWERELARREGLLRGRKGPEAVVGLLGLVVELGGEIADTRLDGLLRGVGEDRRQDPLVRSYAGYLRGELAEARGDRAAARRFYEAEGYVLGWQIVGPFDNSGGAGHDAIFAPETTPFDGGQSFTGTLPGEALLWQQVDYDQAPRRGYVALDDRLSPSEHATGYATVWIRAARPTAAALHLGTSGPYRVWLDDEEIGDGGAYRAAHPLQETHGLALAPGVHRLLVKVSAEEGGSG
jgi:hypothetical protein